MRILITNLFLKSYSGSENVVQLLAEGLRRAGHYPVILAPALGEQADFMRSRGFQVVDRVEAITETPDVIHGQHLTPCLIAMARFPEVPVVYACHSSYFEVEVPLPHSQIREVIAVDDRCAAKCLERGVDPGRLSVVFNAVDLERFKRRPPLPTRPKKALLLTKNQGHRQAVRAACARAGLELDELGRGTGKFVTKLETVLGGYDLVFATARMAIEAAAVGCAVIVCDERGFAGMLTSGNLASWRRLNLGVGLLAHAVTDERLDEAIGRYDADDTALVAQEMRDVAGVDKFISEHLDVYQRAIGRPSPAPESVALATAKWIEELTVTTSDRKWRHVAKDLGLWIEPPQPTELAAQPLDTLAREVATMLGVEFKALSTRLDTPQSTVLDVALRNINHKTGWEIGRRLKQALVPKTLRKR